MLQAHGGPISHAAAEQRRGWQCKGQNDLCCAALDVHAEQRGALCLLTEHIGAAQASAAVQKGLRCQDPGALLLDTQTPPTWCEGNRLLP